MFTSVLRAFEKQPFCDISQFCGSGTWADLSEVILLRYSADYQLKSLGGV